MLASPNCTPRSLELDAPTAVDPGGGAGPVTRLLRSNTADAPGSRWILATVALGLMLAACESGEPDCDLDAVRAELAVARSGDTVDLPACTLSGTLEVPAGVRLRGAGREATVIRGATGRAAIILNASDSSAEPTTLFGVRVQSDACAAVVATASSPRADSTVRIVGVTAEVTRGIGVGLEGLGVALLQDVEVRGPLSPASIDTASVPLPPHRCAALETAVDGIVAIDVADLSMIDVEVSGFAAFGVLAVRSSLDFRGGEISAIVGAGIEVWGGQASLTDVTVSGVRDGSSPVESYGAVFANGAAVTSEQMTIRNGDSYGLLHDDANAQHHGLGVHDNGFAGLWAQAGSRVEVVEGSMLTGNGFAGVAAVDSGLLTVSDATIGGTVSRTALFGATGSVEAADGIHLLRTDGSVADVQLANNERIGLLWDLGGRDGGAVTIAGITIAGSGMALGAIAQNGAIPADWDRLVTRDAVTAANDAGFTGLLGIAGAVGPPCIPVPGELAVAGLADLIAP